MEREKLLEEYKITLDSLVEKTKFVYSVDFFKLDEIDKQKYTRDKMTTEAHLNTLCELLWGKKIQCDNGLNNLFGLSMLSYMFNYTSPNIQNTNYLKDTLREEDFKEEIENKDE